MHTLQEYFKSLSALPDSEWRVFETQIIRRTVAKGDHWLKIGDSSDVHAFINQGLLRTYYLTSEGTEFTRNFRCEGQLAGSYSATLTGNRSNVGVEALEDTVIEAFRYEDFASGYKRHPSWQEIGRKIAEAQYISYEKRSYELICLDAEERHERFRNELSHLSNRLTQTQIASYLGITPVSLSRLLGKKHRNAKKSR